MSATGRPFLRRGPSGPLAVQGLAIVQVGYDECVGDGKVTDFVIPASAGAIFPRNGAGDPLRVVLEGVVPGNVLEVDYRISIERSLGDYQAAYDFNVIAIVTFDGSSPLVPSAPTFYVENTASGANEQALPASFATKRVLTALGNTPIPAGATKATVELFYIGGNSTMSTAPDGGLGATLRAAEYVGAAVTQPGPGTTLAT